MAYDLDGTDDRLDITGLEDRSGLAQTVSMWVYPDVVNTYQYFWAGMRTGGISLGDCIFWNTGILGSGYLYYTVITSGALVEKGKNGLLTTGSWQHILVTWDGSLNHSGIHLYHNNVEPSVYDVENNGSGSFAPVTNGKYTVGGRDFDNTRNFNGRIAEVGRWNRVLSAAEITMLANAYSPAFIPNGRILWSPIIRDRTERHTGVAYTLASVPAVIAHPRIIYPSERILAFTPTAAAPGTTIPIFHHHYNQMRVT